MGKSDGWRVRNSYGVSGLDFMAEFSTLRDFNRTPTQERVNQVFVGHVELSVGENRFGRKRRNSF